MAQNSTPQTPVHRDTLITRLLCYEAERIANDLGTNTCDARVTAQLTTVDQGYQALPTDQLIMLEQGYLSRRAASAVPTVTLQTPQARQDYLRNKLVLGLTVFGASVAADVVELDKTSSLLESAILLGEAVGVLGSGIVGLKMYLSRNNP